MTERFAIDRDPALEALLYEPDRNAARNAPLPDNFYKVAIAGGSIVPPISGAQARWEDRRLGLIACIAIFWMAVAVLVAFIWR